MDGHFTMTIAQSGLIGLHELKSSCNYLS